jgi:NAD(P)H-nitrite reductase large subunit
MERYLIIGDGVAATRAAEAARAHNQDAEIVLMSAEVDPFYRRPQLGDVLAGRLPEERIAGRPASFYADNRLQLVLGKAVEALDPVSHSATLVDGSRYEFTRALIATGKRPRLRDVGGATLPGLNTMMTLAEVRSIRSFGSAAAEKTAVVFGDSLMAFEAVRGLAEAGFTTTYLVPGSRLWPEVLDDIASSILENRLRAAGAQLVLEAEVTEVIERGGRAGGFSTRDGASYEADIVCFCDGYESAVDFLPAGTSLEMGPSYATSWEDIYAAGDVLTPRNQVSYLQAWRGGAAAGVLMTGGRGEVRSPLGVLNSRAFGLSLAAIGQTAVGYRSGYGEMRTSSAMAPGGLGDYYKKLVFDPEDTLVGAFLLGNVAEAGVLEEAVREGRRKREFDPVLLKQMFEVTFRTSFRGVECPVCRHEIQLSSEAAAGDMVVCPVCGVEFVLEESERGFLAIPV